MKKLILVVLLIMLSAQMCFAAGSCTQRTSAYVNGATVIQLACTGTTSFSCATAGYSSGSNTIYVGCYDAAGNSK